MYHTTFQTRAKPKRTIREKARDFIMGAKEILRETGLEVAIAGVMGAIVAGGISMDYERARSRIIPISFSEISQLERNATEKNQPLGELTEFYAKLWDANAKTLEAHNYSWKNATLGGNQKSFAKELEVHMDPAMKIHRYNLDKLLTELPGLGTKALRKLKDLKKIYADISSINEALDKSWSESHIDSYRTEVYTDTESYTDSDGKSHTRTVMKTRQVYDHTTHSYSYRNEYGEQAVQLFSKFLRENPNLVWPEELRKVNKTNADGEYAAESSRDTKDKHVRLSPEELVTLANEWNTTSTYTKNKMPIISSFSQVPQHSNEWQQGEPSAHSTSYITYSHFDSGPKEFRVVERALYDGRILERETGEILYGIERVMIESDQQRNSIKGFIASTLDKQKGNPKKLQTEIMTRVKEWNNNNFKGNNNLDRTRALMVLMWTFLGGLAGAGIGFGIDKYTDLKQTWGKSDSRRY
jgi:hypothetical protein